MTTGPAVPDPDDKDWTWVLQRACPECGFDSGSVGRAQIAGRLLAANPRWQSVLRGPRVAVRPAPQVWSALEYACHVNDVHALFAQRGKLIQDSVDPAFVDWNQDETALQKRYWEADPAEVAARIEEGARTAASVFTDLSPEQWSRSGRRSNGSVFTMETLGLYYLHDIEHHLYDVGC